ncbi:MAG: hypothetical protein H6719_23635 [Sandaracinaceae bacterium]|nr:hypothetical protein [Sandaracinaceae bacterium]
MRNLLLTLAILLVPALASAQNARVRVSRGGVTGVEMSLEGGLTAPRGGTLRWIVTAYEVVGLSELRPAQDATLHVATSLESETDDAFEVHTDAFGRALVDLAVPADAPGSFTTVLRLVHANGVQRRYDLNVSVRESAQIELHTARTSVPIGGTVRAFGRLANATTRVGLGGQTVRLILRDGQNRPLAATVEVTTDPAGLFAHAFRLPEDVRGGIAIDARTTDDEHPVSQRTQATVGEPQHPALIVAVAPERWLVRPGERQYVDVIVRNPQGRPMAGTTVTLDGANRDDAGRSGTSDARGRVRLSWEAPRYTSGLHDQQISVTANREGWGQGRGAAGVRIAADANAIAMAVEGGSLVPSLGGRVYVRVVQPDGRPAGAGVTVNAQGPRLPAAGVTATTDASGLATLDVTLPRNAGATGDRCGGETATAIDVTVGGTQLATCLGLDPDAAARVRVARSVVRAGGSLDIEVDRVAGAARWPVELTVLSLAGPSAIASGLLAANERTASLTIPDDAGGLVWVRARPLVGAAREVVRGGVTGAWIVSSDPMTVSASLGADGRAGIRFGGAATAERSAFVVATPIDDAQALRERLLPSMYGPLGDLRQPLGDASDALLAAAIAANVTPDEAAPAVLRGSQTISSPAPSNPVAAGLLRDPWRSRARFVTGRLALIVRALEGYVSSSIPERVEDVAVQGARGFTFNGQILESVAQSGQLGPAGATGLGGDPLTIEQLQRFDPSLTYDNVARRITRERLFSLIVALRTFVAGHGFDLPWSRLGDPSEWMRQLQNQYVQGIGPITRQHLVDGWGRPFELRPSRGGRSRFSFVDPLGSWEIVSAGPDGRFGTGDDQWDPTARVLRSGTPYAEAVGEDILVARLEGVELGRASLQLLRNVEPRANAGGVPYQASEPARARAQQLWNRLPSVVEPPPAPLGLRRPGHPGDGAGGRVERLAASGGEVAIELDEEPRTWGAVVWAWTDGGYGAASLASTLAGSPLIVEADFPPFLHTSEPVDLDVVVTNVTDGPLALSPSAEAAGVSIDTPGSLSIGAGEAAPMTLRLRPEARPARGHAHLDFATSAAERVRRVEWSLQTLEGSHPQRLRAAGLARARPWRVRWSNPRDARFSGGRVVLLAPSALGADPDLADLRERDPALVAFSDALAGRRSDPELWARLLRRQRPDGLVEGDDSMLSTACAAVAWASADRYDADARNALARVHSAIAGLGDPTGRDPGPEGIRTAAAALGALAAGGVPDIDDQEALARDPVARLAAILRIALRRSVRNYPEEPSLLARSAAALLLANPRDAYGLAMLEAAERHLEDAPDGGARVVPSEASANDLEALAATAALAVAAHQAGRRDLADRLTRGALGRDHVAAQAGSELIFWQLAGGAYGALGADAESVDVVIDGQRRAVALEGGRGVVALDASGDSHEVVVEAAQGAAFVRVEAVAARDFVARGDGPYELRLDGDVGDAVTGAGLELTVHATRRVDQPTVLSISLPAGVSADPTLRARLGQVAGVTRVEARDPAFVRLWLAPMGDGTDVTIPLAFRWTVRGSLRGLGVIAAPLGRPEAMTVLAPRGLEVPAVAQP